MSDPVTPSSFSSRRLSIAASAGFPTGLAGHVGYAIIPEFGVEAHVGSSVLFQDYGADLVVRPFALRNDVVPTLKTGMSVLQSNITAFGGPLWIPMPTGTVGIEWRSKGGFLLGLDVGIALPITERHTPGSPVPPSANTLSAEPSNSVSHEAEVIPKVALSVGYAF